MHPDWITPDWPAPASVRAVCTTRAGGISEGRYASLNLGDHVGDDASRVRHNRALLRQALAARPVYLRQMHGDGVALLDALTPDGCMADAAVTSQAGLACTVMMADCLPVLLCGADGSSVAAAHAGWRGITAGVLAATVEALRRQTPAAEIMAWLGPCIGPEAFEVGAEVRNACLALPALAGAEARALFSPRAAGGTSGEAVQKYLANLPGLARLQLAGLGVRRVHGNDGSAAWCTYAQGRHFFSHRRDGVALGACGRMAAAVWRA